MVIENQTNEGVDKLKELRDLIATFLFEDQIDQKEVVGDHEKVELVFSHIRRRLYYCQLHLVERPEVIMDLFQRELAQLSEDCNGILGKLKIYPNTAIKNVVELISIRINELFDYLAHDFKGFFNVALISPELFRSQAEHRLTKNWKKLIIKFKDAGVETEMITILQSYALELQGEKCLSFRALSYWEDLFHSLLNLDLGNNEEEQLQLISSVFFYYNFNYLPFVRFCTGRIQRDYNKVDNYREEFIEMTIQLRTIRQFPVRNSFGYDLGAGCLDAMICSMLEDEISCLKKLISLNKGHNGRANSFMQQFYFRISISMEQFLFIFRLLIDMGVVIVKRKADLYQFIHNHVGTVNKDHLSIGNMQNSFSENNRTTAVRVRALLQTLITQIDTRYL